MTIDSFLLFDVSLALTLVAIAASVLLARDLFQAIVFFIVFGLLLAVAWCRLEAVDVAMAEVAIGAGLTGALLLNTWASTRESPAGSPEPRVPSGSPASHAEAPIRSKTAVLLVVPLILAACGMAAVVVPLAFTADAPRIAIDEALPNSGVTNPVTAVLLNFRAYDTLLEVVVLLAAVLAVTPLTSPSTERQRGSPAGPVLGTFTKWMVPVTALVAVYVLWTGTKTPGGAFQAAAMLCAAGVLLLVSGTRPPTWTRLRWRVLLAGGLALFLVMAFVGMLGGGHFLQYHAGWARGSILLIETALTVSLSLILIRLFSSTSPSANCSAATDPSRSTPVLASKEQES